METTVNSRVQLLKKELRLTTMDFCSKAKISGGTYQNIRIGENVNQKTLNSIIDNLNVNADWLINGKGEMFNQAPKQVPLFGDNPYKDALVAELKAQNERLIEQNKWFQGLVNQFTTGLKPNFRKALKDAFGINYTNNLTTALRPRA